MHTIWSREGLQLFVLLSSQRWNILPPSLDMGSETRLHITPWLLLCDLDEVQWKTSQGPIPLHTCLTHQARRQQDGRWSSRITGQALSAHLGLEEKSDLREAEPRGR